MKPLVLLAMISGIFLPGVSYGSDPAEKCAGVLRAESFRQMNTEELGAHRAQVAEQTPATVVTAICESTAAVGFTAYRKQLDLARQEYLKTGRPDFDPAEFYFFVECGEDRVNLSPLAYHAFNLNRDEYGFIGESTLAIVWMSIGYLEIDDPTQNRSFLDAIERLLAYARKTGAQKEIEIYEDLLQQIDGFREDYTMSVEECRSAVS